MYVTAFITTALCGRCWLEQGAYLDNEAALLVESPNLLAMPFAFRVARAQRDGIRASLDAALDAGVPLSAIQHLVVIISSGVPQRRIVDARSVGTEQFICVGAELLVHLAPPWDIHGKAELEHQQCVGCRLHPRWSPPPPMPALAAPAGKHLADSDQTPRPRRRRGRARKGRVREGVEVGISTTLQIAQKVFPIGVVEAEVGQRLHQWMAASATA